MSPSTDEETPADLAPGSPAHRLIDFDHHAPSVTGARLYQVYDTLLDHPVHRSPHHGGFWILARHDDVEKALLDWRTFSSAAGTTLPRHPDQAFHIPIDFDPPQHTEYRRLFNGLLGRRRTTRETARIESTVVGVVDEFVAAGGGDFIAGVAARVPVEVLCTLFGVRPSTAGRVRELSRRMWSSWGRVAEPDALRELVDLLEAEARERLDDPRDDLLTELVGSTVEGRPVSRAELRSILTVLFVAGHETTMNTAALLAHRLVEQVDLQERLRHDAAATHHVVDELLRHQTPAQIFTRTVTVDTEVHGCPFRAGDRVLLAYGAANRDPRRFSDPDRFDPDRADRRHLAFGRGPHACPGAHLAMLELTLMVDRLVGAGRMSLAGDVVHGPLEGGHHLGLRRLPIRFDPHPTPTDTPPRNEDLR